MAQSSLLLLLVLMLSLIVPSSVILFASAEHPSSGYLDPNITYSDIIPPIDYEARGYKDIGKQYAPASIANKCLYYFSQDDEDDENTTAISYGIYVAEWLALRAETHEPTNAIYFTYDFPWAPYNLTTGWKSALAQGLTAECFLEAFAETGRNNNNSNFLDMARKSLMFLRIPIQEGGVMIEESESPERRWWYEEYPSEGGSYVLNGHQFVLIALSKYLEIAPNNHQIRELFDNGLNALKFDALMYDYGYNASVYDRLKRAPANAYHDTHIINFQRLYDMTGDKELLRLKEIFME